MDGLLGRECEFTIPRSDGNSSQRRVVESIFNCQMTFQQSGLHTRTCVSRKRQQSAKRGACRYLEHRRWMVASLMKGVCACVGQIVVGLDMIGAVRLIVNTLKRSYVVAAAGRRPVFDCQSGSSLSSGRSIILASS